MDVSNTVFTFSKDLTVDVLRQTLDHFVREETRELLSKLSGIFVEFYSVVLHLIVALTADQLELKLTPFVVAFVQTQQRLFNDQYLTRFNRLFGEDSFSETAFPNLQFTAPKLTDLLFTHKGFKPV